MMRFCSRPLRKISDDLFDFTVIMVLMASISLISQVASAQQILAGGQPVQLSITPASNHTLRITLSPTSATEVAVSEGRVLVRENWDDPILQLTELKSRRSVTHQNLRVTVTADPLTVDIRTEEGKQIQHLVIAGENTEQTVHYKGQQLVVTFNQVVK